MKHAWYRSALLLVVAFCLYAEPTSAQVPRPLALEVIEVWIKGGVPVERISALVKQRGLAFGLNDVLEARLRALGAPDSLISLLQQASVVNATETVAVLPQVVATDAKTPAKRELSREELAPLYFGADRTTGVAYFTVARMRTIGGMRNSIPYNTGEETVVLTADSLPETVVTYGLRSASSAGWGVDVELYLHQPRLKMLSLGSHYEPFLPIRESRVRAIVAGATSVTMIVQDLATLSSYDEYDNVEKVTLWNWLIAADARAGFAFHFRRSGMITLEVVARVSIPMDRDLRIAGKDVADKVLWSAVSTRGLAVRFGVGGW